MHEIVKMSGSVEKTPETLQILPKMRKKSQILREFPVKLAILVPLVLKFFTNLFPYHHGTKPHNV